MKTYRYKDSNGEWVRSIYPKPTAEEEVVANGIIALLILGVFIYALLTVNP